jgi:hypothetical protein
MSLEQAANEPFGTLSITANLTAELPTWVIRDGFAMSGHIR